LSGRFEQALAVVSSEGDVTKPESCPPSNVTARGRAPSNPRTKNLVSCGDHATDGPLKLNISAIIFLLGRSSAALVLVDRICERKLFRRRVLPAHDALQPGHDIRMRGGDVFLFGRIGRQVVKFAGR
jgi:hypothetical protein